MIDLAVLITLQTRWAELCANSTQWKELIPPYFDDTMKQQWFDYLAPTGASDHVQFAPGFNVDLANVPQVVAHQEDEPLEQQPLGLFGGTVDLTANFELLIASTVHLTMYCANPDALRALFEVVRGMMLGSIPRLLATGFVSVRYLGGGDIMPEAGLLPDDLGVMMRLQRWQVVSQVVANDAGGPGEHKNVFVYANDITVDGNKGGVEPVEE